MVGPKRQPEEEYVVWIKRATRVAEEKARKAKVPSWGDAYLQAKWRWAGKIANMCSTRWARKVTEWRDHVWWKDQSPGTIACPTRSRPGRYRRWEDDLVKYSQSKGWESWLEIAKDVHTWSSFENDFINF